MRRFLFFATGAFTASICLVFYSNRHILSNYSAFPQGFPSPERYNKNDWVSVKDTSDASTYRVTYVFMPENTSADANLKPEDFLHGVETKPWSWIISFDRAEADAKIATYGLPPSFFSGRFDPEDPAVTLKRGAFRRAEANQVEPDFPELVSRFGRYSHILSELTKQATKNPSDYIPILISFVQDIPYGVPPDTWDGRVIAGLWPQPATLASGYGDCDTKSLLFADAAQQLGYDVVLLEIPGHMLTGMAGIPGPYQDYLEHAGKKYIYAEPVGVGKLPVGKAGFNMSSVRVIDLK